jgi:hypothetical protein
VDGHQEVHAEALQLERLLRRKVQATLMRRKLSALKKKRGIVALLELRTSQHIGLKKTLMNKQQPLIYPTLAQEATFFVLQHHNNVLS